MFVMSGENARRYPLSPHWAVVRTASASIRTWA